MKTCILSLNSAEMTPLVISYISNLEAEHTSVDIKMESQPTITTITTATSSVTAMTTVGSHSSLSYVVSDFKGSFAEADQQCEETYNTHLFFEFRTSDNFLEQLVSRMSNMGVDQVWVGIKWYSSRQQWVGLDGVEIADDITDMVEGHNDGASDGSVLTFKSKYKFSVKWESHDKRFHGLCAVADSETQLSSIGSPTFPPFTSSTYPSTLPSPAREFFFPDGEYTFEKAVEECEVFHAQLFYNFEWTESFLENFAQKMIAAGASNVWVGLQWSDYNENWEDIYAHGLKMPQNFALKNISPFIVENMDKKRLVYKEDRTFYVKAKPSKFRPVCNL